MDVTVREIPAYRVAYVRRLGYAKGVYQEHLNQAFQQVCGWVGKQGLFGPDTLVIGVPHDNPDITPNDLCRYDACVTVPDSVPEGNDGVDVQVLRGGKYAVCRIDVEHPAEIGNAVTALYGEWLPSSGFRADDRPCLEIYRDGESELSERRIVLDYCLPVATL